MSFFFSFSTKKEKVARRRKKEGEENKGRKKIFFLSLLFSSLSLNSPDPDGRRPGHVRGSQREHGLARAGAPRAGAVVSRAPLLEDGGEAAACFVFNFLRDFFFF